MPLDWDTLSDYVTKLREQAMHRHAVNALGGSIHLANHWAAQVIAFDYVLEKMRELEDAQ